MKMESTVEDREIQLKAEYEEFLKLVGSSTAARAGWEMIARALAISPSTIEAWKKLPEARMAKMSGITRVMNNLDTLSLDDYRASKELLRIYGMDEKEEPEVQIKILKFEAPTSHKEVVKGEEVKVDLLEGVVTKGKNAK